MDDNYVSILGGRYITNGHIVKNASPYSVNSQPIAQVVVGGYVGYHLKYNKKRVFYSIELIRSMYEQEAGRSCEYCDDCVCENCDGCIRDDRSYTFDGWTIFWIVVVLWLVCGGVNITFTANDVDNQPATATTPATK